MSLKQSLSLKLHQKLSPQQIQLMKLLQLPTIALEQRIKEEIEMNPALEEGNENNEIDEFSNEEDFNDEEKSDAEKDFNFDDYVNGDEIPSYRLNANNTSNDDESKQMPYSGGNSFHDLLDAQMLMYDFDEEDQQIASFLIGSIDESGYLRHDLNSLVDDLVFTQNIHTTEEHLKKILSVIQQFDPAGVGARTLQECLLLQLKRKKENSLVLLNAKEIIQNYFEELSKKHFDKIAEKLSISDEDLKDVIEEITKLNPKPGSSMNETSKIVQHIIPDFILTVEDKKVEFSINSRNAPELKISNEYQNMIQTYRESKNTSGKSQKDALMFIKQKLDSAKWFIDAIKQRQDTLMITMEAIVKRQEKYFLEGDETLIAPMILKDIAEEINMDISTVSRVVNSKYVQTPYGTFLLKTFFSESLSTESGEEVSSREVKKILKDAIDEEDKSRPLTDDKLSKILNSKGYNIARRTVAKYREQLGIPVARMRKEL